MGCILRVPWEGSHANFKSHLNPKILIGRLVNMELIVVGLLIGALLHRFDILKNVGGVVIIATGLFAIITGFAPFDTFQVVVGAIAVIVYAAFFWIEVNQDISRDYRNSTA